MAKRRMSAKFKAAGSAWRSHLSQFRKDHPNMTLKQQMKGASKTYKKSKSSGSINIKTNKFNINVKPRASKRKTKRSKRPKRTGRKKKSAGFFGF